ncbi:KH domain-containing protein [Helicobacter sp. MIT 00-7814]|nr:KH domain-containing protein [Helicobacter sp. MIT 99-10781]RDU56914.1 KH domain-containing protein [Helicobacter sp. MIT 00-7814]
MNNEGKIEDFIEKYAKKIVTQPQCIKVQSTCTQDAQGNKLKDILVYAHPDDVGRLIGKEGKMISSLKTLISGAKAKDGQNYKITIESS